MSRNPNSSQGEGEEGTTNTNAPFDPTALSPNLSTLSAQAHLQAATATPTQQQLLNPYLSAINVSWGAANPFMSAMLAQQQQLQLLQQHALLGSFHVPSPTVSGDAHNPMGSTQHSPSPNSKDVKNESSNSLKADTAAASLLEASQSRESPLEPSSKPDMNMLSTQQSRVDAHVMLGVPEDKYYLSDLQCILRGEFIEAFGCGKADISIPTKSRETEYLLPVQGRSVDQVGLQCKYCQHIPPSKRANHAITYPNHISSIYNTVKQMFLLHFEHCECIPSELRERVNSLKDDNSNRGRRKQYWVDSAKRIGLVDTPYGINFSRDPSEPLPPLSGLSGMIMDQDDDALLETSDNESVIKIDGAKEIQEPDFYPLVLPEDKPLISDYLYLALEQMQPANLLASDRVGCYKGRRTGFPGLACKHCVGQAGCGRYFPASEASLSQTTTSQTIVNHVRNCRRCPIEVREELELMKRVKGNNFADNKPRHGGRKVFFHRLWCRIQRIPLPKQEKLDDSPGKSSSKQKPSPGSSERKRKKSVDFNNDDDGKNSSRKSAKMERSDTQHSEQHMLDADDLPSNNCFSTAFEGSIRLSREDDEHWLSDASCFIRQELVEAFTATEDDLDDVNATGIGQVGIRCVYCAQKQIQGRSNCHVIFPTSLANIEDAVSDLQRRHLLLCTEIPTSIRATFRSLKGFDAKPGDSTAQYWVDSAKELGLCDYENGQGEIVFFRNPHEESPADEIDNERKMEAPTGSFIVRAEDRESCTDHIVLLLKQFTPCRFELSDKRGGVSKNRDRPLGFPGFQCIHCNRKRYFPIAEKKISDTTNLMMTHITNCRAPNAVKASLCYLQHRAVMQKFELMGNWKITFFKRVWNRLHHEKWDDGSYIPEPPSASSNDGEEGLSQELLEDNDHVETFDEHVDSDNAAGLEQMRGLIQAAAIWLTEQDANAEERVRSGRGIGTIQTVRHRSSRGRGGKAGIRRRLST